MERETKRKGNGMKNKDHLSAATITGGPLPEEVRGILGDVKSYLTSVSVGSCEQNQRTFVSVPSCISDAHCVGTAAGCPLTETVSTTRPVEAGAPPINIVIINMGRDNDKIPSNQNCETSSSASLTLKEDAIVVKELKTAKFDAEYWDLLQRLNGLRMQKRARYTDCEIRLLEYIFEGRGAEHYVGSEVVEPEIELDTEQDLNVVDCCFIGCTPEDGTGHAFTNIRLTHGQSDNNAQRVIVKCSICNCDLVFTDNICNEHSCHVADEPYESLQNEQQVDELVHIVQENSTDLAVFENSANQGCVLRSPIWNSPHKVPASVEILEVPALSEAINDDFPAVLYSPASPTGAEASDHDCDEPEEESDSSHLLLKKLCGGDCFKATPPDVVPPSVSFTIERLISETDRRHGVPSKSTVESTIDYLVSSAGGGTIEPVRIDLRHDVPPTVEFPVEGGASAEGDSSKTMGGDLGFVNIAPPNDTFSNEGGTSEEGDTTVAVDGLDLIVTDDFATDPASGCGSNGDELPILSHDSLLGLDSTVVLPAIASNKTTIKADPGCFLSGSAATTNLTDDLPACTDKQPEKPDLTRKQTEGLQVEPIVSELNDCAHQKNDTPVGSRSPVLDEPPPMDEEKFTPYCPNGNRPSSKGSFVSEVSVNKKTHASCSLAQHYAITRKTKPKIWTIQEYRRSAIFPGIAIAMQPVVSITPFPLRKVGGMLRVKDAFRWPAITCKHCNLDFQLSYFQRHMSKQHNSEVPSRIKLMIKEKKWFDKRGYYASNRSAKCEMCDVVFANNGCLSQHKCHYKSDSSVASTVQTEDSCDKDGDYARASRRLKGKAFLNKFLSNVDASSSAPSTTSIKFEPQSDDEPPMSPTEKRKRDDVPLEKEEIPSKKRASVCTISAPEGEAPSAPDGAGGSESDLMSSWPESPIVRRRVLAARKFAPGPKPVWDPEVAQAVVDQML